MGVLSKPISGTASLEIPLGSLVPLKGLSQTTVLMFLPLIFSYEISFFVELIIRTPCPGPTPTDLPDSPTIIRTNRHSELGSES